jgi:hypothetical protein
MGIAGFVLAAAALVQAGQAPARHPQPLPDPLVEPVRVEVRVTTGARTVRLGVLDAALLAGDGRRESGLPAVRAVVENDALVLSGNTDCVPATAVYRLIVSARGATLRLAAAITPSIRAATIQIVNLNDEARPAIVTELTTTAPTELQIGMAMLRTGGPLPAPARRERLVLAHYYPWWTRPSWAEPRLLDQPLQLYASDDAADVARVLRDMAATGIDVAIVSWQGSASGDGFYALGLRRVLDAAQQAGIRVSVMLETAAANRIREGEPPDVDVLTGWITELIDGYASHPAFLKVDSRPVLFAYIWGFAGRDVWQTVLGRVRATGRQPLMMADTTSPNELVLADGTFTYSGTLFEPDVPTLMRRSVVGTRAWHLLGAAYGPPRIAAASVIPGFDETRLGRDSQRVVDRQGGDFYDRQWQAALATDPDWVVITSWNEWAENTEIEAGQRFGRFYVWRTRFWSAAFQHAPR